MGLVFVILLLSLIPVGVMVLVLVVIGLRRRVADLERKVAQLGPAPTSTTRQAVMTDLSPRAKAPAPTVPQPAPDTATAPPENQPVVVSRQRAARLFAWLGQNWVYAVSAVSLVLAGVFLVQYSIENALLSPTARIAVGLLFGAALIAGGEWIRRRFGDSEETSTAYLPSVFSGAGLVTLFGAILAARVLYDLIGPLPAFAGLVGVAAFGLVLGWFHGPLLAAIGLIGGFAAPFLIAGESETPSLLFLYFAVLSGLGLGVDTVRRWGWISALTLALAFGAAGLLSLEMIGVHPSAMAFCAGLVLMAVVIPQRTFWPSDTGAMVLGKISGFQSDWPSFPVRLSAGTVSAASLGIVWLSQDESAAGIWLALLLLAGLALWLIVVSRKATALQDHVLAPVIAAFVILAERHAAALLPVPLADLPPETPPAPTFAVLIGGAAALSFAAFLRSFSAKQLGTVWALGAVLIPASLAALLEARWSPVTYMGAPYWAGLIMALAALMVWYAVRYAATDGTDRTRTALATVAALGCMTFSVALMLSDVALTLAFAAVIVLSAALDRAFNLPLMALAISGAVMALGWRLVADPGLGAALDQPWSAFLLSYGGGLIALVVAKRLIPAARRATAHVILDTALLSTLGTTLSLAAYRVIKEISRGFELLHVLCGLMIVIWLCLMAAQLRRTVLGGWLQWVRRGLAMVFGLIVLLLTLVLVLSGNPVVTRSTIIAGPPVLNTLIPAFLAPAVAFWGVTRLAPLRKPLRIVCLVLFGGLAVLWLGLTIRHVWQGPLAMQLEDGIGQGELYSYTVALLLAATVSFGLSLTRRSALLGRVAMALVVLTVVKVFFIDISGLSGLVRVMALLVLGLALAGFAWLNRWAQGRSALPHPDGDQTTTGRP